MATTIKPPTRKFCIGHGKDITSEDCAGVLLSSDLEWRTFFGRESLVVVTLEFKPKADAFKGVTAANNASWQARAYNPNGRADDRGGGQKFELSPPFSI